MRTYMSLDHMWNDAVAAVMCHGGTLQSRAGACREMIGYSATLETVDWAFLSNPVRAADPSYAAAETLWYLSGDDDVTMLLAYAPQYKRFAEDDGRAFGAYGKRWANHHQLGYLIETLVRHPESRQAVLTMWRADDLVHAVTLDKRDLPCTLSMQFLLRGGALHLVVTMRSNDLWLGMPYDVFAFTCVQRLIAGELGVRVGSYTHNVGSVHLYEKNWAAANDAMSIKWPPPPSLPPIDGWDSPRPRMSRVGGALLLEQMMRVRHDTHDVLWSHDLEDQPMLRDLVALCQAKLRSDVEPPVKSLLMAMALQTRRNRS